MEAQELSIQGGGPSESLKRVFKCGECDKSYTRVDHLTRHVRSHTREKPYRCDICSKGFSRGDLLKRHAAAHKRRFEESKQNGTPAHEIISRVTRACKACSEMHLRCDDVKPCERCVKRKIQCIAFEVDSEPSAGETPSSSTSSDGKQPHARENQAELQHAGASQDISGFDWQAYQRSSALLQYAPQTTLPIGSSQSRYPPASSGYSSAIPSSTPASGNQSMDQATNWLYFPFTFQVGQDSDWFDRSLFCFGGYEPVYLMNDVDMQYLDTYNYDIPFEAVIPSSDGPLAHPSIVDSLHHTATMAHDAHQKHAVWKWDPQSKDASLPTHRDLRLPPESSRRRIAPLGGRTLSEKLDSRTRGRLMRLVVKCYEHAAPEELPSWDKWNAIFPSVELLDALIQFCLHAPLAGTALLFHLPTMSIREMMPELLLALVAMGAILTPDVALRKLGMALHEVVRLSLLDKFEHHHEVTRDLQAAQALHVNLVVGFWSGDSRKTQLAEALMYTKITMERRANRYRRHPYHFPAVTHSDEGQTLEQKWQSWIIAEQWKRLVHHGVIGDAMGSLMLLAPPLISYSEVVLPLPDNQLLWSMSDAASWKQMYLSNIDPGMDRLPSLHDCMVDMSCITRYGHILHDQFMIMGITSNIWRKVWEYRQDCTLFREYSQRNQVILAKEREVLQLIQNLRLEEDLSKPTNIITLLFLEIVTVHVHMSLDDVQLFTGLEGVDEARRVYPELVAWSQTAASRQAIWHAGQVLRIAKNGPKATLNGIAAIAVYQSALVFWTYGLMLRDAAHAAKCNDPTHHQSPYIWLDELQTDDKRAFIEQSHGQPIIRGLHVANETSSLQPARLDRPARVMDVVLHLFKSNWSVPNVAMPVLVENLIKLMTGLKHAAEQSAGPQCAPR